MFTIDAHQHFWKYDPVRHSWIGEEMSAIRQDFLPGHLEPILAAHQVNGCIAIQADQSSRETEFLIQLAAENDFIRGVVGWVNLQSADIGDQLDFYQGTSKLKGFRHILQGEPIRDLFLQPAFVNGLSALERYGYCYDLLVLRDQLSYLPELLARFPNQRFVLDHLAKPAIKSGEIDHWKKDIECIARYDNLYCKLSGMVTEADLQNWKQDDFLPFLDIVVNAFGTGRIMYGSDWPVCLAAGSYGRVMEVVKSYFRTFSFWEQERFFGKNASEFYHL